MKVLTGSNELFVSQISQIDLAFIWQFNFPSQPFYTIQQAGQTLWQGIFSIYEAFSVCEDFWEFSRCQRPVLEGVGQFNFPSLFFSTILFNFNKWAYSRGKKNYHAGKLFIDSNQSILHKPLIFLCQSFSSIVPCMFCQ